MKPNIELDIQQLIVEGYSRSQAYAIKQAVVRKLHQLFNDDGTSERFHEKDIQFDELSIPPIRITKTMGAAQIGHHIGEQLVSHFTAPIKTAQ